MPDVTSLLDLENIAWELQGTLLELCDNVENKEPLQARQTFDVIKERIRAVEAYIDTISPVAEAKTDTEAEAKDGSDPDTVPSG